MDEDERRSRIASYLAKQEVIIEKHGHAVQMVFADPESESPPMAYSIGLAQQGMPELIVFGIPPPHVGRILNDAIAAFKAKTMVFDEPCYSIVDAGPDNKLCVMLKRVEVAPDAAEQGYLSGAIRRANQHGDKIEMAQLFWTDTQGYFPWDGQCDPIMRLIQDRLTIAPAPPSAQTRPHLH